MNHDKVLQKDKSRNVQYLRAAVNGTNSRIHGGQGQNSPRKVKQLALKGCREGSLGAKKHSKASTTTLQKNWSRIEPET